MRVEFAKAIITRAQADKRIVFISGDLGFMALEEVRDLLGDRFINAGVAEQNMISMAAGLAAKGFIPVVYSIAPFATMRPFEQIRNDVCLHNLPVKVVGNGGGYGYGIMGATHHALEDVAIMRALPNMSVYVPAFGGDVSHCVDAMFTNTGPSYLRLGKSVDSFGDHVNQSSWQPCVKITSGTAVLIAAMGPVIENVITWLPQLSPGSVELWSMREFPIRQLPAAFIDAVMRIKKIITLEEHYRAGGLAENLSTHLLSLSVNGLQCTHLCAEGYPSGRYGSQQWHQEENGLSGQALLHSISQVLHQ